MKKLTLLSLALVLIGLSIRAQEENRKEIKESFSNITEVEINTIITDVTITQHHKNTVDVNGFIEWHNPKKNYEIIKKVKGTKLLIKIKHPVNSSENLTGELNLKMPTMTDVNVYSIKGMVDISGVGQKYVKATTISGPIKGKKLGSNVIAKTVTGKITLRNIAGDVDANTISGGIELEKIAGDAKAETISGGITTSGIKGTKDLKSLSGSTK